MGNHEGVFPPYPIGAWEASSAAPAFKAGSGGEAPFKKEFGSFCNLKANIGNDFEAHWQQFYHSYAANNAAASALVIYAHTAYYAHAAKQRASNLLIITEFAMRRWMQ